MKMFNISEYMDIPPKCKLGSTIFKKQFYENAKLNKSDKELFTKNIDKIHMELLLKNSKYEY